MNKILFFLNWLNWNIGGLRDDDCFFEIDDPEERLVKLIALREPEPSWQ